jgi:mannose-1-phosphate guanylyltransferase/phosphomannomutase
MLSDTEAILALIHLLPAKILGDKIAVPISTTRLAATIADRQGAAIRWTKLSNPALMDAATEAGVGFAGNQNGQFILPGFMPAFDAAATLVKVLDLLAFHGTRLSSVVASLPKSHVVHETVVTPWEQKGTVMRSLVEISKGRDVELIDGIKVNHDDDAWVLALPDPEDPITHIWAEAASDGDARRLAQEYARRIRQLVR